MINFNNPPREYFPLPYQRRISTGKAGPMELTNHPLKQGPDTGKVYWDVYINAIIQKALADNRTHEGDFLWSGGSLFFFPAGKYHLCGNLFFYDTNPENPKYGQSWTNINIQGQGSATKFLAEGNAKAIYMTGYCGGGRNESANGSWMRDFWSQGLDICLGVYDEELQALHGSIPQDPNMTHGIWSLYIDKLYVHTGGIIIKRLSSDISITDCTFDYGTYSIDIRDQVYSVTIQNNHFWNRGPCVRIVHSTERFDWQRYFSERSPRQREGYQRGGLVIINGNRDTTPGTSKIPIDEGVFHIENCDNVIFTDNYLHDTRQPVNLSPDKDENWGGRLSPLANFCNGRALSVKNCKYVNVANNIFAAFWPKNTGVITFDNTHFSSITNNIITPFGGMNRSSDQLTEDTLKKLPDAYGIHIKDNCTNIQLDNNITEEAGRFRASLLSK